MMLRMQEKDLGVCFRDELPSGFNSLAATRTRCLSLATLCYRPYLRDVPHTMRLLGYM
jgi:hypothetical protein